MSPSRMAGAMLAPGPKAHGGPDRRRSSQSTGKAVAGTVLRRVVEDESHRLGVGHEGQAKAGNLPGEALEELDRGGHEVRIVEGDEAARQQAGDGRLGVDLEGRCALPSRAAAPPGAVPCAGGELGLSVPGRAVHPPRPFVPRRTMIRSSLRMVAPGRPSQSLAVVVLPSPDCPAKRYPWPEGATTPHACSSMPPRAARTRRKSSSSRGNSRASTGWSGGKAAGFRNTSPLLEAGSSRASL